MSVNGTATITGFAFASDPAAFPPGSTNPSTCPTADTGTPILNASGSLIGYVFCDIETAANNGIVEFQGTTANNNVFDVRIASDFEQNPELPTPGTLALFGIGLAGIGVSRRSRRWQASS